MLWKVLGRRATILYLVTVAVGALATGIVVDALVGSGVVPLSALVDAAAATASAHDHHHAGEQRDEGEEERDARAQAERSTTSHGLSVAGGRSVVHVRCQNAEPAGSPAAGGMPGGGRHPTGAA
jgi:hypothetical protein